MDTEGARADPSVPGRALRHKGCGPHRSCDRVVPPRLGRGNLFLLCVSRRLWDESELNSNIVVVRDRFVWDRHSVRTRFHRHLSRLLRRRVEHSCWNRPDLRSSLRHGPAWKSMVDDKPVRVLLDRSNTELKLVSAHVRLRKAVFETLE